MNMHLSTSPFIHLRILTLISFPALRVTGLIELDSGAKHMEKVPFFIIWFRSLGIMDVIYFSTLFSESLVTSYLSLKCGTITQASVKWPKQLATGHTPQNLQFSVFPSRRLQGFVFLSNPEKSMFSVTPVGSRLGTWKAATDLVAV